MIKTRSTARIAFWQAKIMVTMETFKKILGMALVYTSTDQIVKLSMESWVNGTKAK